MKMLFSSLNILRVASPRLLENVIAVRFFRQSAFRVIEPTPYKILPEPLNAINHGIGATLPDEYKKFYTEWKLTEPLPVHYTVKEGKWERNHQTEQVQRIYNLPIHGHLSPQLHESLTGGETIIQGYQRRQNPKKKRAPQHNIPHYWMPVVKSSVVYSEILDKYMSVLMTHRVIKLIHQHEGFDNYILETRACDLGTNLAVRIKRVLLTALSEKNLPYDEEKNEAIYEKYKKYLIPPEEIEWYGLNFTEALKKAQEIQKEAKIQNTIPYKEYYRQQLIEYLKNPPPEMPEIIPEGFTEKLKYRFGKVFRGKSK